MSKSTTCVDVAKCYICTSLQRLSNWQHDTLFWHSKNSCNDVSVFMSQEEQVVESFALIWIRYITHYYEVSAQSS